MVMGNADRIIGFLHEKKTASIKDITSSLSISREDVDKSLGFMEEDGVVKIDRKLGTETVTLLEKDNGLSSPLQSINGVTPPTPGKTSQFQIPGTTPFPIPENSPFAQGTPSFSLPAPMPETIPEGPIGQLPPKPPANVHDNDTQMDHEEASFDMAPERKISMYDFPEGIESSKERIEYLLEIANNKITDQDYQNLNVIYRHIYNSFQESTDISINERRILAKRINQVYQRIKRMFLIEDVM